MLLLTISGTDWSQRLCYLPVPAASSSKSKASTALTKCVSVGGSAPLGDSPFYVPKVLSAASPVDMCGFAPPVAAGL